MYLIKFDVYCNTRGIYQVWYMVCRLQASVKIKVGTLCIPGQVYLLSRYSLVLTCVVCLEEEYSFIPFVHGEIETKHVRLWKPLVFHLRYGSQVLQINTIPVPESR